MADRASGRSLDGLHVQPHRGRLHAELVVRELRHLRELRVLQRHDRRVQRRGRHGGRRRLRSAQAGPDRLPDRAGGRQRRRVAARAPRSGACSSPTATSSRRASSNVDDPDANRALAIYDISKDCRKPKLLADVVMPSAVGHEGCFQADGMVYYMASTDTITPIDISDPSEARSSCRSRRTSGSTAARPARTASARTSPTSAPARLLIADTSEVQARKQNAEIKVIGELPTPGNDGQQSTIPIFYNGRPHIFNFSEYAELARAVHVAPRPRDELRLPDDRRHRRRAEPEGRLEDLQRGDAAGELRRGRRRLGGVPVERADQGRRLRRRRLARLPLRLALLLDRPHARPDDRRVRELRLRHPRLRHPRPAGAEGDRLLQPGHDRLAGRRGGERDRRAAGDPQRPRPDLVRRHRQGLLHRAVPRGRLAVPRPGPVPARGPVPRAVRPQLPRAAARSASAWSSCRARRACNTPPLADDPPAAAAGAAASRASRCACAASASRSLRGGRVRSRFTVRGLPKSGRYRVRVVARTSTGARLVASRRYRACVPKLRKKAQSASRPAVLFASGVDPEGFLYYCRMGARNRDLR